MTRPVWSGAIQFALISIPVKLHKANRDADVHFKNVHAVCHSTINQKKWCPVCKVEVLAADLNKGFALSKDKIVEFSEAELESISIQENKQVIIERAVDSTEIPITAYDSFYYLQPEKYGEHVYSLLAQVLMLKKQVLIGRFIMRSKEHLAAIHYHEGGLLLTTLHWSDELHAIGPLLPIAQTIPEQEVQLATTLLEKFRAPLGLETFKDTYREKVVTMIEKRAKGEVITVPEIKIEAQPPKDIMAELKRSLEIPGGTQAPQIPKA